MKTITNKVQKLYEASVRMLMIKEGKSLAEAQLIVLEVVKEFKKSNEYGRPIPPTKQEMIELAATLELTFLK
jgi:phosphoheptose isomerase